MNWRLRPPTSSSSVNLIKQLTEWRETLPYVNHFGIKYVIKDTCEQPDEEVYRARSGWWLTRELLPSGNWGGHLTTICTCSLTWKTIHSCSAVFIKLNSSPCPFFPEVVGWVWKFQSFNHLVFLVACPILKISRGPALSHFMSINSSMLKKGHLRHNKRHSCPSGNSKCFRSFMPRLWDKDQLYLLYHNHIKYLYCLCATLSTQCNHQLALILQK